MVVAVTFEETFLIGGVAVSSGTSGRTVRIRHAYTYVLAKVSGSRARYLMSKRNRGYDW